MTEYYIPMHWTPEQAAAVFEFVDDIRDEIIKHYQSQILEYAKENYCYDPKKWKEFEDPELEDKDIPF